MARCARFCATMLCARTTASVAWLTSTLANCTSSVDRNWLCASCRQLPRDQLAIGLSSLRRAQHGFCAEHLVVRLANVQSHLGAGERGKILLGRCLVPSVSDKRTGAAKVGDQLGEISAIGKSVGDR